MAAPPPPITLDLAWQGEMRFAGRADGDGVGMTLGGARAAGPSSVQALAFALAGRMAIDVVQVLTKGRDAPAHAVERAGALSREKYCSVWHSLRPDIDFHTSFEVRPREAPA